MRCTTKRVLRVFESLVSYILFSLSRNGQSNGQELCSNETFQFDPMEMFIDDLIDHHRTNRQMNERRSR